MSELLLAEQQADADNLCGWSMPSPAELVLAERQHVAGVLAEWHTPSAETLDLAQRLSVVALLGVSAAGKERHGSRAIAEVQDRGLTMAHRVRGFATRAMRPEEREMLVPPYEHYYDLEDETQWCELTNMLITGGLMQVIRHRSGKVYGTRPQAYVPWALNIAEYTAEQCVAFAKGQYFENFTMVCLVPETFATWDKYRKLRDGPVPEDNEARLAESWQSLAIALHEPELDAVFVVNNYGENDAWRPAYLALADCYLGNCGEEQVDERERARVAAKAFFRELSIHMSREAEHDALVPSHEKIGVNRTERVA